MLCTPDCREHPLLLLRKINLLGLQEAI